MIPFSPGQILDAVMTLAALVYGAVLLLVPAAQPLEAFASHEVAFAFASAAFLRFAASVRSGIAAGDKALERGHSTLRIMGSLVLAVIAGSVVAIGCAQLDRLKSAADAYCDKPAAEGSSSGDEPGSSGEDADTDAAPDTGSEGSGQ